MENLGKILRFVDDELGAMAANGKFKSRDEVHTAYELIDIAKDIYCIWKYEDKMEDEDEYSEYGRYPRNPYPYARKRDSMGRYSRDDRDIDYKDFRGGRYPRDDAKHEYIEQLRDMMNTAPDEMTRQKIQRMIHEMEQG